MTCDCKQHGARVVRLCRAHQDAFVRLRNESTDIRDVKQRGAVTLRLRGQALPDLGDYLYDALGTPVVRVNNVITGPNVINHRSGMGVDTMYGTGGVRIEIRGLVIDPETMRPL